MKLAWSLKVPAGVAGSSGPLLRLRKPYPLYAERRAPEVPYSTATRDGVPRLSDSLASDRRFRLVIGAFVTAAYGLVVLALLVLVL
jgi:hypothetical protein